jgi:hypothetical protein
VIKLASAGAPDNVYSPTALPKLSPLFVPHDATKSLSPEIAKSPRRDIAKDDCRFVMNAGLNKAPEVEYSCTVPWLASVPTKMRLPLQQ